MRAGSHYTLQGLAEAYGLRPAIINRDGASYEVISPERLSRGLYQTLAKAWNDDSNIVLQYHYYHKLAKNIEEQRSKTIHLIGYPFDTFYSDGLVFSKKNYSLRPADQEEVDNYILRKDSPEFKFLEPYMRLNAEWLEHLSGNKDAFVIRYEDYFNDFVKTTAKIQSFLGPFKRPFPQAKRKTTRSYWNGSYRLRMEESVYESLAALFRKSISHFYPEKSGASFASDHLAEEEPEATRHRS